MNIVDFFLEGTLEYSAMIFTFKYGGCPAAFICFACTANFNTIFVHSGYKLPWCPDPTNHITHHKKYNVNFGIGPLDKINGTNK
jgi:sterol desaturase/sphingolipid hydroxylase (fatty acid hydroxylase superfamily)